MDFYVVLGRPGMLLSLTLRYIIVKLCSLYFHTQYHCMFEGLNTKYLKAKFDSYACV